MSARCTQCGAPVGRGDGLGLCVRCVLEVALGGPREMESLEDDEIRGEIPSAQSGSGVPVRLGDYELVEEVARGGMGVVYRARQRGLGRFVALKVLLGGAFAGAEGRRRLLSEAAAAARLQHPGIVAVYEAGSWEGQPFYSMEFVEGQTLAELIRSRDLSPVEAATYVAQVAAAVHYAHEQGVLHRDLKPSNILIDAHDRPRITDFGLARVLDSEVAEQGAAEGITVTGQVLGSPAYMSPEQASGRSTSTGRASDVYSLGAILYEAMTGRAPFQGPSPAAILEQVRMVDPIPPRHLNAGLPADLETVCLKCLEKNSAHRYRTAGELADELDRFLRGEPVRALPVGWAGRGWRWARRNPSTAVLALVSVGLLLAVTVVSIVAAFRVRLSRDEARARLAESHLSEARAVRAVGEAGHRTVVLDLVNRAQALDASGRLRLRLRQEAIAALARPDERRVVLTNFPMSVDPMLVCFDPGFEVCAMWDEAAKHFTVRRVPGAERLAVVSAPRADEIVAMSADRRFLMLRHQDQVSVWDVSTDSVVVPREGSEGSGGLPGGAFGPAPRWFGRGERGGRFVTYAWNEIEGVRAVHEWPLPRAAKVGSVAWSTDGRWVVLTTQDGGLSVHAADTGVMRWERRLGPGLLWGVAWNGPQERVAVQAQGDRVLVFDATDGAEIHRLPTPTDASARVAFSPDGETMVVSTERFGTRLVDALTGRMRLGDPAACWHLQFDGAGGRLGTLFDRGRPAWREWLPSSVLVSLGEASSGNNQVIDFTPDGTELCALSAGGVRVWPLESGKTASTMAVPGVDYAVFDLDPARLLLSVGGEVRSVEWRRGSNAVGPRPVMSGKGFWGSAVSRGRGRVAVVDHKGHSIHVLDAEHRPLRVLGPVELPGYVGFSPDGRWLAVVGGRDLWVWDLDEAGAEPRRMAGGEPAPRFSPDGRWLLTLGATVRLWRVGTWEPGEPLPLEANPAGTIVGCFSPDGRWLVVTQRDREVHWLDFAARRVVAVFDGPGEGRIVDVGFTPDGTRLAVARERGEVQVWKVAEVRRALRSMGLDWD